MLSARSWSETAPNDTSGIASMDPARRQFLPPHEPQNLAPARRGNRGKDHRSDLHVFNLDKTKMKSKLNYCCARDLESIGQLCGSWCVVSEGSV